MSLSRRGRYIVTATTPFTRDDLATLRADAAAVVRRLFPDYEALFEVWSETERCMPTSSRG